VRFLWRRRRTPPAPSAPSAPPAQESPEEAFAELLLDEGREELERADNKASIFLGASGLVLGIFLGAAVAGDWNPTDLGHAGARAAFWVGTGFAFVGVLCLGLAVVPRIKHDATKEKLAYFGHVIQYRERGWAIRRRTKARREAEGRGKLRDAICAASRGRFDRTVDQVWAVSHIVQRKYKQIRRALWAFGLWGILCAAGVLLDMWR
jgi:hypothetical protein